MLKIILLFEIFATANVIPRMKVDHGTTDDSLLIEMLSFNPTENVAKPATPTIYQPQAYTMMQNSYILYRMLQRGDSCEEKQQALVLTMMLSPVYQTVDLGSMLILTDIKNACKKPGVAQDSSRIMEIKSTTTTTTTTPTTTTTTTTTSTTTTTTTMKTTTTIATTTTTTIKTTSTTTTPIPSSICHNVTPRRSYFAHPDCTKYVRCVKDDQKYTPVVMTCPVGTAWANIMQACADFLYVPNCNKPPV